VLFDRINCYETPLSLCVFLSWFVRRSLHVPVLLV